MCFIPNGGEKSREKPFHYLDRYRGAHKYISVSLPTLGLVVALIGCIFDFLGCDLDGNTQAAAAICLAL